jgi:hypothetical protein
MSLETAADLLTWKNMEVEENAVVEFAELYENLLMNKKASLLKQLNQSIESMCRR